MSILWATQMGADNIKNRIAGKDLSKYEAVVVRADLKNQPYGAAILQQLKAAGVKIYAYVRAPVHYNTKATSPYESAIKQLSESSGAVLNHSGTGKPLMHSAGYDGYTRPWQIAQQHAQLTAQMAWDPAVYDGILADGLVTNQLYTSDPANTDYAGTGTKPTDADYPSFAKQQLDALQTWAKTLKQLAPGIKIIGNGAWEPKSLPGSMQNGSYQWDPNQMTMEDSGWMDILDGVMDEKESHPYYHGGSVYQQLSSSQRAQLHKQTAEAWLARGKTYWAGGGANKASYPQGVSFIGDVPSGGTTTNPNQPQSYPGTETRGGTPPPPNLPYTYPGTETRLPPPVQPPTLPQPRPEDGGQPYNPYTPPTGGGYDPWAQLFDPWGGGDSMPNDPYASLFGGGQPPGGGQFQFPNPYGGINPGGMYSGGQQGGSNPFGFPSPAQYWNPDPWSVGLQATNVWGWPFGYGPMTQPGTGTQPPGGYGGYNPQGDFGNWEPGGKGFAPSMTGGGYGGNTFTGYGQTGGGDGQQGAQQAYTPNDDGAWEVLGNLNLFPDKATWDALSPQDKLGWITSVFPYVDAAAQNKLANAKMINENNLNKYDRLFNQTTTQWQQQADKAEFDRDTAQMGYDNAYKKWATMGYEIDQYGRPYNPTLEYQKFQADQAAGQWGQQQQNLQNYLGQLASRGLAATIDPQTGLPTSETMNLAGQKQKNDIRNLQASMYGQDLGLNAEGGLNKPDFMNTQNYREWFASQFGYDPGMYGTTIGGGTGGGGGGTEGFARTGTEPDGTPTQQLTLPAQQQQWMQQFQTQNAANDWAAQQAGLTGMFNGAPTLAGQQQTWNQIAQRAGLMGYMQEAPAGGGPPEMNPTQSMQQQLWAQNTQFPEQMKAQKEQAAWASFGRQFAPNPRWM